jgi:hypothetical protein
MVMACSTYDIGEECTQLLIGKPEGKILYGKPRRNGSQKALNHNIYRIINRFFTF